MFYVLFVPLLISLLYPHGFWSVYNDDRIDAGYVRREPIVIIGDSNFTHGNGVVAGSGSADDPYVIEGWFINASGSYYSIRIENTTKYFIIRNCIITGGYYGIFLLNVVNGKIMNNTITNNMHGIFLMSSSNNVIVFNNFINNDYQVYSHGSINTWDLGYPRGGNYWSDHDHMDRFSGPHQNITGRDGICDKPYSIYDKEYRKYQYDHYPYANPLHLENIKPTPYSSPSSTPSPPTTAETGEGFETTTLILIAIVIVVIAITIILLRKKQTTNSF